MSPRQRRVAMLIAALCIMAFPLAFSHAQDNATLRVSGSGLAAPILEQLASQTNTQLDVSITGSNSGISSFCANSSDIAVSTRPLTAEEEYACTANQVDFNEFVLGHNILMVVHGADDALPECLTTTELDAIFAPSSSAADWTAVAGDAYSQTLSLVLPTEDTVAYNLLDAVVNGIGLRSGSAVTTLDDRAAILAAVRTTPGAVAVVTATSEPDEGITAFSIDNGVSGCVQPTADNVERRLYTMANRLFAYVNSTKLDSARALFDAAFADSGLQGVSVADVVPPSAETLDKDRAVLADNLTGRQFSREVTAFSIPANVIGEVKIAGSAEAKPYMQAMTAALTQNYPTITITYIPQGIADGNKKFCNGEVDMTTVFEPLSADELAACAQNNVTPESFSFGTQAVVLLENTDLSAASCLTTAEVSKLWGASADGAISNWSAIRDGLPDEAITLFTPPNGSIYRDILVLQGAADQTIVPRMDTQDNTDPAWRTAATANVPGGMTFMSWKDYLTVPADQLQRVQLVSIDGGSGCVEPSEATLADGTYPLARPLILLVNHVALARQDVQSLLWFASSDEEYSLITDAELAGMPFDALADRRDQLETLFRDVAAEVLAQAEATPEAPAPEATAESTESSG